MSSPSTEAAPAAAPTKPHPRIRPPHLSLAARLIALATVWSLAVLLLAGFALSNFFHQASISRFDQSLADVTDTLYAGSTVGEDGSVLPPAVSDARMMRTYSGRYWQIAEPRAGRAGVKPLVRSRSLFDAELDTPAQAVARAERTPGQSVFFDVRGPESRPLRVVMVLAHLPGRDAPVIFMAGEDRTPIDRDARRFAVTTAATLVALGMGLVAAVFIQVRVGLGPLFLMGREIAEVRQGKSLRLTRAYPAELAPLAGELNALLDNNQAVVERQRTHVGNLAHALKTPISVMLAEAERQPGPLAEIVARQSGAMRDHVDHHLRRARAAARSQSAGERTPVGPVLDELCRTLERIFRSRGVEIDWRGPEGLTFRGERQDLLELAGNVLENACKWCDERVRAEATVDGPGTLRLVIDDDGPGLPAERRGEVLARGARLDESAPGSGLGLAIVDELARAYGGVLTLADSPLGGLRVVLVLPRAEA